MWPWGHLVFGYLLYLLVRPRAWRNGDRFAVIVLMIGTQVPDIVDKPLAWWFGVLPSGVVSGVSVRSQPTSCMKTGSISSGSSKVSS